MLLGFVLEPPEKLVFHLISSQVDCNAIWCNVKTKIQNKKLEM